MLIDAGRPQDALRILAPHVASAPDDASALRCLALAHRALGQQAEADDASARAIAVAPDDVFVVITRAAMVCEMGRPHDALPIAEHAARLAPQLYEAHHTLVQVLIVCGDPVRAEAELAVAASLVGPGPQDQATLESLRVFVYTRMRTRKKEALAAAQAAVECAPLDAGLIADLALIELWNETPGRAAITGLDALRLDAGTQRTRDAVARLVDGLASHLLGKHVAGNAFVLLLAGWLTHWHIYWEQDSGYRVFSRVVGSAALAHTLLLISHALEHRLSDPRYRRVLWDLVRRSRFAEVRLSAVAMGMVAQIAVLVTGSVLPLAAFTSVPALYWLALFVRAWRRRKAARRRLRPAVSAES
jgi:hypothetical protein